MFDEAICFLVSVKKLKTTYFIVINNVSLKSLTVMEENLKTLCILCSSFLGLDLSISDINYTTIFIPVHVFEILSEYKVELYQDENILSFRISGNEIYSQVLFEKEEIEEFEIEPYLSLYVYTCKTK